MAYVGYLAVTQTLRAFAQSRKGTSLAADVGISRTLLSSFRRGKCDLNVQDSAVLAAQAGLRLCLVDEDALAALSAREVTGGDRRHGSTERYGGPLELDATAPVSTRGLSGKEIKS